MLTVAQLATSIILICGVTIKNVDKPKVQDCVNFFVNCVVSTNGQISDKDLNVCEKKWSNSK